MGHGRCLLHSDDNRIQHVVYIQFDNVHFRRDVPNVPADLEQMSNLRNFLVDNGTVVIEKFDQNVSVDQVRAVLDRNYPGGGQNAVVQATGDPAQHMVMIRVPEVGAESGAALSTTAQKVETALGQEKKLEEQTARMRERLARSKELREQLEREESALRVVDLLAIAQQAAGIAP